MSLDNNLKEIRERAEKDFEKMMAEYEKLDKDTENTRKISRDVIYKIILISSSIIAFSVSLVSLDFLNERINITQLYFSWKFFLVVIILGFFILFIEPRIKNALVWRYFIQDIKEIGKNEYDNVITNIPFWRKAKIFLGLIVSILCPENLIFSRITKNADKKRENAILSHLLLAKLASTRKTIVFWTENLFLVLFFIALFVFIKIVGVF